MYRYIDLIYSINLYQYQCTKTYHIYIINYQRARKHFTKQVRRRSDYLSQELWALIVAGFITAYKGVCQKIGAATTDDLYRLVLLSRHVPLFCHFSHIIPPNMAIGHPEIDFNVGRRLM